MNVGDELPSCSIQATGGPEAHLNDYRGQWLILYFYPKDATPGCTKEGQDFRDNYQTFQSLNTIIFGISRDNLKSHERFKTKQAFPFELISDTDEILCQQFAVIKMKSMYGKQVRSIERSTFLFDPRGKLRHIWRKVNVKEHVHDVLDTLKSLQAG